MARAFSASGGSGVLLFDEDFDLPPPAAHADPEVIEPVFTLSDLNAAREQAARESREAALAEAAADERAAAGRALAELAHQIAATRDDIVSVAEQSSEAICRLLLDCFAVAFPALGARHGAAEAAAMLRRILPALHHEPKITVRVNPHIAAAIAEDIESLDPDLSARVKLISTDAIEPGDAKVTWEHGAATRDTASLWHQIEAILAPAGLLNQTLTAKENALVD